MWEKYKLLYLGSLNNHSNNAARNYGSIADDVKMTCVIWLLKTQHNWNGWYLFIHSLIYSSRPHTRKRAQARKENEPLKRA